MVDAGCFTADATGTALDIAQGQVASGDALGIVTVSPQISQIEEMAPEGTTFETALPATNDPSQTKLHRGTRCRLWSQREVEDVEFGQEVRRFDLRKEGLKIASRTRPIYPSAPVEGSTRPPALAGVSEQAGSDQTAPPTSTWPERRW